MLDVIRLNVVMPSVVAPRWYLFFQQLAIKTLAIFAANAHFGAYIWQAMEPNRAES
jgi:hypothetical protein